MGTGWGGFTACSTSTDLEGDGRYDLVALTKGGELYEYAVLPGGALQQVQLIGSGWTGIIRFL